MNHRHRPSLLIVGAILSLISASLPVQAQPNLRSTFPGRRVGGATRGECSARLIAHLVPSSSVFVPGDMRLLGILEGPTANPRPIQLTFRPEPAAANSASQVINLPAAAAGVVLFPAPKGQGPMRWESSYQCDTATTAPNDDPLAFVSSGSPPALTLLIDEASPEDTRINQALQKLRKACGGTVSRAELASSFALTDVLNDEWPAQLPVRCVN